MVEKLTLHYLATALLDIPAVSMPIAHLWYCVKSAHFSGLSLSAAQGAPV